MFARERSLAGALALVGVGLLANEGVYWMPATLRIANAEELRPLSIDSRWLRSERTLATEGSPPTFPIGGGSGCVGSEPQDWFAEARMLPACAILDTGWFESTRLAVAVIDAKVVGCIDINADGTCEGLKVSSYQPIIQDGSPVSACLMELERPSIVDGMVTFVRTCVLSTDDLVQAALSLVEGCGYATFKQAGWQDVDMDGDLDLVVLIGASPIGLGGVALVPGAFWLENTGFEATQPLVGDLDGDGTVGASDLTMLLGGWTGT